MCALRGRHTRSAQWARAGRVIEAGQAGQAGQAGTATATHAREVRRGLLGRGRPTKKMRDHVRSLMRQTGGKMGTVVDDATWALMNDSFNATPLRKQKQWKFELHGSDGTSIVKYINGEFVDHNAQTGEPQIVKPISSFEDATCVPVTERGEHAVARALARNARRA